MNPQKPEDRRNLMDDVDQSRLKLDEIRENRRALLKRAAGSEWYPEGSTEQTPLNQMAQQEQVLVQHLVGGEPRALVVPGSPDLDAIAYEQTLALNKVAQQVGLRRKLRRLVRDAIYGMGICRIGMTAGRYVPVREIAPDLDEEGEVGIGRLTLEVISLENWVHDCQADSIEEREYCGHCYWVDAEDLEHYLPGVDEKDLLVEEKRWIDEHGSETAGAISRGSDGNGQSSQRKRYWLWDLWLPRENAVVTTPVNGTGEVAYVRPWNSRPGGPYLFLYYRELPDQAMPISIQADLALVHDSLNSTFRKLIDQTREAKTVLGFRPGHEDDAARILETSNQGCVQMRDPTAVQEFHFNGPDQALLAMLLQERELASIIGGNTDALGGLGSQAPTLGQEEIVNASASGKIQSHEVDTAAFAVELFEAVRWYLYHEQIEPIPIVKEVEGTNLRVLDEFSAAKAQMSPGRFDAFALQIEPDSLKYRSPEQRFQAIVAVWQNLILPALQMGLLQQAPDVGKLLDIAARYTNLPELKSIVRYLGPGEEPAAPGGGEARQSPVTTRNYVRRGAPGPSRQGMAMQALQMMGQGRPEGAEQ